MGRDITTNFVALTAKTAKDEGIAGPIDIGFSFPFFDGAQSPNIFTQLYVSPNGFVTFNPFTSDTSVNRALPGIQTPTNLIAFFWDDLDLSTTGRVSLTMIQSPELLHLQFQDVRFKGLHHCDLPAHPLTTGEILMQYKSAAISNSCTVGVQNAARSQGLQVAFNQNYVQSNLCVRLSPNPWLSLSANAGLVPEIQTVTC